MKIVELRFKNLNSLYGEWVIDFTDPEYAANGIFALTGPTGAGKSTVLDGICLALYGATPRLGKITRSGNEIMSRQTGECYAEVLFESQAGRFRCHWEQRRARTHRDGRLQDQQHQIFEAETGIPIETKKSLVTAVIEEKTGMDFDRFTRSILLAQGGFDTFLKADAEQKSRILEQITGTGIYSAISQRVHERQREAHHKLNLLRAETTAIMILERDQEKQIEQQLEEKQKEEVELSAAAAETGKAKDWLNTCEGLKKEISKLTEEELKVQRAMKAFEPERTRLALAHRAASLEGTYATLGAIRKQLADDQASLEAEQKALPDLEGLLTRQVDLLKSTGQRSGSARQALKTTVPVLRQVRSLDERIGSLQKRGDELEQTGTKEKEEIDAQKAARQQVVLSCDRLKIELESVDRYLNEHSGDEWLTSGLAALEDRLNSLLAGQREIDQHEIDGREADKAVEQAVGSLDEQVRQSSICRREVKQCSEQLARARKKLAAVIGDRLLREYRADKESLLREKTYLAAIAELESHRDQLADGIPCPLCGSPEHPFARGNVPRPDEHDRRIEALTRLISEAEAREAAISELETALAETHSRLSEREKQQSEASHAKIIAEKHQAVLSSSLDRLRADHDTLHRAVSATLAQLGVQAPPEITGSGLLESLRNRQQNWQNQLNQKNKIREKIAELESEIKQLDRVIETQTRGSNNTWERLKITASELAGLADERFTLLGDKDPDGEEQRLKREADEAESAEKKAAAHHQELNLQWNTVKDRIDTLTERLDRAGNELQKSTGDFLAALEPAGFKDEQQFLAARLSPGQRDALSDQAGSLDDQQKDIAIRLQDRQTQLELEIGRRITDHTLAELEARSQQQAASLKLLRRTIAALNHRLAENRASRERLKNQQSIIEARVRECARWDKLHGLIGSADGKKYRNFAQGITFELMVAHANRQLADMSERYLLLRDMEHPLELNVVDNFQAGEIRSTRNLSGGESFMVSLALALGLSGMASRRVRVDSLFLDEGFGTLDEEALENALETLSGLQQDGKLIGIISHVPALKDRISTQISVSPLSGGRSTLAGPGCARIS